jgi:hypothetical protein
MAQITRTRAVSDVTVDAWDEPVHQFQTFDMVWPRSSGRDDPPFTAVVLNGEHHDVVGRLDFAVSHRHLGNSHTALVASRNTENTPVDDRLSDADRPLDHPLLKTIGPETGVVTDHRSPFLYSHGSPAP